MRVNLSILNALMLYQKFLSSGHTNADWLTYYQQQGFDIQYTVDSSANSNYTICEKHLPFLLLKYGDLIVES